MVGVHRDNNTPKNDVAESNGTINKIGLIFIKNLLFNDIGLFLLKKYNTRIIVFPKIEIIARGIALSNGKPVNKIYNGINIPPPPTPPIVANALTIIINIPVIISLFILSVENNIDNLLNIYLY